MAHKAVIVIPTYNEAENIEPLVEQILKYDGAGVMIVDDASPDGTGEIADRIAAADDRVTVLHGGKKSGLGKAYRRAFKKILSDDPPEFIFEMDADFSHDPSRIPAFLVSAAYEQYDLVIGSRYLRPGSTPDWSTVRRAISFTANFLARRLLDHRVTDYTSGFRCYRSAALAKIDLDSVKSEGYAFQVEMAYRFLEAGSRVGEVPIVFPDRSRGRSKFSKGIIFEAAFLLLRLALRRFLKSI
ncbi:MAG: polyprenol monophosphomannose synthase [Planctomycetota bacterium]|nr:MAG: polyprenol monophosphomannose synthase [Planctomycetota bacterium]